MMPFVVRRAGRDDAPSIARLEEECFSDPWSEKSILEELENENSEILVCVSEDTAVAYAGMQTAMDEGYILNVAVGKEFRRRGLGRALMENLISRAKEEKLSFVTLEMRRSNAAAAALYASLGFEQVGIRKNYYVHPREDALLMTLFFGDRT